MPVSCDVRRGPRPLPVRRHRPARDSLGFASGYFLGFPKNVAGRVSMWLSPWDNSVRGGEQVAHSLWAFATGGAFGTGSGLGDPQWMPAAHTDLILAALGEEWGFLGRPRGACPLRRPGLVWHPRRPPCPLRLQLLPRPRPNPRLCSADPLIAGGVLGSDTSLRCCRSVPQLRQNGTHHQLRDHRNTFFPGGGTSRRTEATTTEPFRVSTRAISYVIAGLGACLLLKGVLRPGGPCGCDRGRRRSRPPGGWGAPLRIQPSAARRRPLHSPRHHLRPQRNPAGHQQLE